MNFTSKQSMSGNNCCYTQWPIYQATQYKRVAKNCTQNYMTIVCWSQSSNWVPNITTAKGSVELLYSWSCLV